MSKTKIALLGPSYPYKGGIVHFNYLLARKLQELYGDDITLYTWHRLYPSFFLPKPVEDFQDKKSKEKIELDDAQNFVDYLNPFSWIKLVRNVRRDKSELFITHWQQPVQFPVYVAMFLMLKMFTRAKIVVVSHNVQQHESSSISKLLTNIIYHLSDRIIVHSKTDLENAIEIYPKGNYLHLFLPLFSAHNTDAKYDKDAFIDGLGLKEDQKILLFFGFIRPYKGLEYLIKALPGLRKKFPDLRLIIAGELFWKPTEEKAPTTSQKITGLPFKALRKFTLNEKVEEYNPFSLIDELGVEDIVVLRDTFIPNEDVPKYFDISDVLVTPYVSASQSAPVQVAYSLDKPVIASNVGGLTESVKDGVSGYLFESKNVKDLEKKVTKFYQKDDGFWQKSVHDFSKRFSWNIYIEKIVDSFDK